MTMQASTLTGFTFGSKNQVDQPIRVFYQVNSPDVRTELVLRAYYNGDRTNWYYPVTVDLGQKAAGQYSYNLQLTESQLHGLYRYYTKSSECEVSFIIFTYTVSSPAQQVGEASSRDVTLRIPENEDTCPAVTMTVEPVNNFGAAFDGLYIKGKTKMRITMTADAKYEADLTLCQIGYLFREEILYSINDPSTAFPPFKHTIEVPLDNVTTSEPEYPAAIAEDSRGFSNGAWAEITVIDYAKPVIDAEAYRCDSNGNKSETGTYMRIKAKRSYSKVVSGGVQKNFCEIRYRIKAEGGDYGGWTTILARTAASDEVTTSPLLGNLDTKTSYAVQIQAIDDIGDYGVTVSGLPTEEVYMHRHKNGLALGKYVENGDDEPKLLDVAWNAHFRGEVLIGPEGMTLREYILSVINEGG